MNRLMWGASPCKLAADLERAVAIGAPAPRTKQLLDALRQALEASLADAGPREGQLIAGLLFELDELEPRLDTGRVRWLGGIERQCRIISLCDRPSLSTPPA